MMLRSACHLIVILSTLAPAVTAAQEAARSPSPPDLAMSPSQYQQIEQAVEQLLAEAGKTWRADHRWPRKEADFAKSFGQPIDHAAIIEALGYQLHRLPAVDGYVKWQLMSFRPELAAAEPRQMEKMIYAMPPLTPQPEPQVSPAVRTASGGTQVGDLAYFFSGRQRAFVSDLEPIPGATGFDPTLSVLQEGVVLAIFDAAVTVNRDIITTIRTGNARLNQLRNITQGANAPNLRFRQSMINALPAARGVRFAAMLEDVKDRLTAGDPSTQARIAQLLRAAAELNDPANRVSAGARRHFVNQLKQLHRERTLVARELVKYRKRILVERDPVEITNNDLHALLRVVSGR